MLNKRKRAAASMDALEATEIHLDLGTTCEMFPAGDDLPLFSGTPMHVDVEPFKDEASNTQTKFATCPICFDTGSIKISGVQRACWCKSTRQDAPAEAAPDDEDVDVDELWAEAKAHEVEREAEIESETQEWEELERLKTLPKSKRLARVQRNAPAAYPEAHNDIETVLKEAAVIEPLTTRILKVGVESLSTVELLTVLLSEQTPILASRILAQFGSLSHIYRASHSQLHQIKGMTPRRSTILQCALALANRRLTDDAPREEKPIVKSPADAAEIFGEEMWGLDQEEMHVLLMDTKNRVQRQVTVYRGSVHTTVVRVCELFKEAAQMGVPAIIIAHNHPSGDPTPSPVIWRKMSRSHLC